MKRRRENSFKLYGIFGFPIGHTISPAMQEAAFRERGIKAFYLPFEVREGEFRRLMKERRRLVLDGFNVTVPYKELALRSLERVSPTARAIGAVNTVIRRGRRWVGENTDAPGFIASLEKDGKFRARGKRILLLGAGGSARAVTYALAKRGARQIVIANRTPERAQKIVSNFKRLFPKVEFIASSLRVPPEGRDEAISESRLLRRPPPKQWRAPRNDDCRKFALVINATSVGLKRGDPTLVSPWDFPRKTLFVDLIYNPAETEFLRLARKSGHRTLNGLGMLVHQGTEAFRLWTGRKAPVEVMRRVAEAVIARQRSK